MALQVGSGNTASNKLYGLEVYVHGLRELVGVSTTTNPCIAFRLWGFPTLFVRPDLANREGHRRGTEASDGCFRSICFEAGKSCLFQVRPEELTPALPLTLHIILVDEVSENNRTVIGSHALVIGEHGEELRCGIKRGVFTLSDVLGNKIGIMTVDVRLTCLGNSTLPAALSSGPPIGGRLLRGQQPTGAVVGTSQQLQTAPQPMYYRDSTGKFIPMPNRNALEEATRWGHGVGTIDNMSMINNLSTGHPTKKKKKRRPIRVDDTESSISEQSIQPRRKRSTRGSESVKKFLRYEVLAQLATLMTLVEDYVDGDTRLGKIGSYPEDEQDFFRQELNSIMDLTHNTNRILSAVDQYCFEHHGRAPPPPTRRTPNRHSSRHKSRDRYHSDSSPPPPPPPPRSDDEKEKAKAKSKDERDYKKSSPRDDKSEKERAMEDAEREARKKAELKREEERVEKDKRENAEKEEFEKKEQEIAEKEKRLAEKDLSERKELEAQKEQLAKEKREREDRLQWEKERDERRREEEERDRKSSLAKQQAAKEDAEREENARAKERSMKEAADKEQAREEEKRKEAEWEKDKERERERDRERSAKDRADKEQAEKEKERAAKEQAAKDSIKEVFKLGDRVRVRDSERENWRNGAVVSTADRKTKVRVDGQDASFTWEYIERDNQASSYTVGCKVRVRDTTTAEWRKGTVESVSGNKTLVRVEGQQQAFTWNFIEKINVSFGSFPQNGDRCRVRDNTREEWRKGTIANVNGSHVTVRLDGCVQVSNWHIIEPSSDPPASEFSVGDRVRVRDTEKEEWRKGVVQTITDNKPMVRIDSQVRAFSWTFVEKLPTATSSSSSSSEATGRNSKFSVGDKVRVRDVVVEDWKNGSIESISDDKVLVRADGQSRAFTWNFVERRPEEKLAATSSSSSSSSVRFKMGDRVKVRDRAVDEWKKGIVTAGGGQKPLVTVDGQHRAFTWEFVIPDGGYTVGDRVRVRDSDAEEWKRGTVEAANGKAVTVRVDDQMIAFTWAQMEPLKEDTSYSVGDSVKVRDSTSEDWRPGTIDSINAGRVKVKLEGQSTAYTWKMMEKNTSNRKISTSSSSGLLPTKTSSLSSTVYAVGDVVKVRDSEKEPWKRGVVTDLSSSKKPIVTIHGQARGFTWIYYEKDESVTGGASTSSSKFSIGDKVRVRDNSSEPWKKGTVESFSGSNPLICLENGDRALSWAMVEHLNANEEFMIGDAVLVRDSAAEEWKKATVESIAGGTVTAKMAGAAKAFTWGYMKKADTNKGITGGKEAGKAAQQRQFGIGARVSVRDSERDDWKKGTVENVDNSGRPQIRVDGQKRAFTWNFVKKDEDNFEVGERVRVRDTTSQEWRGGVVETIRGGEFLVKIDRSTRALTWNFIEKEQKIAAVGFKVGDQVRVRDKTSEEWKYGSVKTAGAKPMVDMAGGKSFTWNFCELDPRETLTPPVTGTQLPSTSSAILQYRVGDKVQVRDNDRDDWKSGVVVSAAGSKPTVKTVGSDRSFTWKHYRKETAGSDDEVTVARPFRVGDDVLVRDNVAEEWKPGVVETPGTKPMVKILGQQLAFTWGFVKHANAQSPEKFQIGAKVRVRDHVSEDWKDGIVAEVAPVRVRVGNQRPFTWNHVEQRNY